MDDKNWLGISFNYWDDTVWAFKPAKIVRHVCKAFPEAEVDPIDPQQARWQRELAAWSQGVPDLDLRERMSRQLWSLCKSLRERYRFHFPFKPVGEMKFIRILRSCETPSTPLFFTFFLLATSLDKCQPVR